jgi:hypothetical protein
MHAQDLAFVAHRTPSRIRIKIPDRQRHNAYFDALKRALLDHPDVLGVHVNPLTASIIVECRAGFQLTESSDFPGVKIAAAEIFAPPHYHHGNDPRLAHRMRLSLLGPLLIAIATRQLGVQLAEWLMQALLQGAARELNGPAADQHALVRYQALLIAMAKEPERPPRPALSPGNSRPAEVQ